jgi:hypothetical protein
LKGLTGGVKSAEIGRGDYQLLRHLFVQQKCADGWRLIAGNVAL